MVGVLAEHLKYTEMLWFGSFGEYTTICDFGTGIEQLAALGTAGGLGQVLVVGEVAFCPRRWRIRHPRTSRAISVLRASSQDAWDQRGVQLLGLAHPGIFAAIATRGSGSAAAVSRSVGRTHGIAVKWH